MNGHRNRRAFLATIGASVGTIATAGCISIGNDRGLDDKLRLSARRLDDIATGVERGERARDDAGFLVDPTEVSAHYPNDYSDGYKESRVGELVGTGTVSALEWPLVAEREWGRERRDQRRCFAHDGTYYRVHIDDVEERDRERWEFRLRWDDQRPSTEATVEPFPTPSLGEPDRELVAAVVENLPTSAHLEPSPFEHAVFHDELDPEASDLVPSPSFEYLAYDDEHYRARTVRTVGPERERTFSAEPVAQSRSEYEQYARETFPDADYDDVELSTDAEEILDEVASSGYGYEDYEEEPPLSDALEEVLEPLGIADQLEPFDAYEESTRFEGALGRFDGIWYEFELSVLNW